AGDSGGTILQSVFLTELILAMAWSCGSIALIYWFLKKRDIFPSMFVWYVGSLVAGKLLLLFLYGMIPSSASYAFLQYDTGTDLIRLFIYAGIWVTYLLRSERVKNTFLHQV